MFKASLFVLLLAQSTLLQAESTDTASLAPVAVQSTNAVQQGSYLQRGFPRWPERSRLKSVMIPPPPPGPYRSSALNDFVAEGQTSEGDLNYPVAGFDSAAVPMETFSPDRAWPEHQQYNRDKRFANRWVPKSGYQYVNPQIEKKTYPSAMNEMPLNGSYGYAPATGMTSPAMNTSGSRWPPSIGAPPPGGWSSVRPLTVLPGPAPGYNQSGNRPPY